MTSSRAGEIRLFCTDRGAHPSRELKVITRSEDDPQTLEHYMTVSAHDAELRRSLMNQYAYDLLEQQGERMAPHRPGYGPTGKRSNSAKSEPSDTFDEQGGLWRFICPTCRRDTPLRVRNLLLLVDGLIAQGVRRFDLSYIDLERDKQGAKL